MYFYGISSVVAAKFAGALPALKSASLYELGSSQWYCMLLLCGVIASIGR
jgi:hypothetical protein